MWRLVWFVGGLLPAAGDLVLWELSKRAAAADDTEVVSVSSHLFGPDVIA